MQSGVFPHDRGAKLTARRRGASSGLGHRRHRRYCVCSFLPMPRLPFWSGLIWTGSFSETTLGKWGSCARHLIVQARHRPIPGEIRHPWRLPLR